MVTEHPLNCQYTHTVRFTEAKDGSVEMQTCTVMFDDWQTSFFLFLVDQLATHGVVVFLHVLKFKFLF